MSETLLNPYFGEFGGMYVPEILVPVLQQLEKAFILSLIHISEPTRPY